MTLVRNTFYIIPCICTLKEQNISAFLVAFYAILPFHALDHVGISVALLKGMENILSNASASSSDDNLNSIMVVVTVMNVSPAHLANLNEPVILRLKHLKVRDHKP